MICNNSFWIQGLRLPFLYRTHIAVCKDVCDVSLVSSLLSLLNFCLRSLPVALLCCIPGQQASLPSSSKPTDDQRWLLFHLFFVSTIPTISICLPKRWETSQAEGNPSLSILVWAPNGTSKDNCQSPEGNHWCVNILAQQGSSGPWGELFIPSKYCLAVQFSASHWHKEFWCRCQDLMLAAWGSRAHCA